MEASDDGQYECQVSRSFKEFLTFQHPNVLVWFGVEGFSEQRIFFNLCIWLFSTSGSHSVFQYHSIPKPFSNTCVTNSLHIANRINRADYLGGSTLENVLKELFLP